MYNELKTDYENVHTDYEMYDTVTFKNLKSQQTQFSSKQTYILGDSKVKELMQILTVGSKS